MGKYDKFLWRDRKRTFLGLPWSFTIYMLDNDKLTIQTGLFTTNQDEIRLYRILDISLRRTLYQKIFGIGSIICESGDKTLPCFEIKNVKKPNEVKELLSGVVEDAREKKRVSSREFFGDECEHDI